MTVCAACDRAIPRHRDTHYWHHPQCESQSEIDWDCCERTSTYHPDCCPKPDCVAAQRRSSSDV